MEGGGFTTDSQVLPTLAAVIEEQAKVLRASIAPFRQGAIDGMADAWGWQGKEARQEYLDGVVDVPPQLEQLVATLEAMAEKLRATAERTASTEQANADIFGRLLGSIEGPTADG